MTSGTLWIIAAVAAALSSYLVVRRFRHVPAPRQPRYRLSERHLEIMGLRVCYVEKAPRNPFREKETILFIHGLGGSLDNWNYNVSYFARSWKAIALDLPGFGKSEKPIMPYSIAFFTKVIRSFMDKKGIRKAVLVGNSMGGHIALSFALTYPSRTEKIVLVDPSGAWKKPGLLLTVIIGMFGSEWWFRHPAPWQIRWFIRRIFYKQGTKPARELERRYAAWALSQEFHLLAQAFYRAGVDVLYSTLRHRLPEVRVPTLLVWGRQDRLVSVKLASYMHRRIPRSQLIVYDRCGHVPMMEKSREFNRDVEKFLQQ